MVASGHAARHLPVLRDGRDHRFRGAWNASIVAEFVQWGDTKVVAHGLGAYIAQTTAAGDYPKIILGIAVMSLFVTLFNRLLWRPMYTFAEAKLRVD